MLIIPNFNTIGSGAARGGGGAPPFEYTAIANNYSMTFDGVDDYIDCGSFEINTDAAWSVSFWLNVTSYSTTFPGIFTLKTDELQGFCCFISQSSSYTGINFGTNDSPFLNIKTDGDISSSLVGAWNNVILTYNGNGKTTISNYSIYVNGSTVTAVNSGGFSPINNEFVLGNVNNGNFFQGKIDEFAIWNSTLSEDTIEKIYNTTNDNPGKVADLTETPEGAPTAWYRFE